MKNSFKKHWGKILLFLILVVICVLSFKVGYSYLSNDNYSPDLNPLLTIERSVISPAWRGYRVLGFASESEQTDVFRSTFYYILDLFLPTWSLSQVFALLCFVVGSWFTALLASNLVKDFGKKKYSELVFLLSGIFYITTLWTVWVFYLNMFPYISQFGFLPLLIWSVYRLVKDFKWKNALVVFLSSIVFTSTCVIATLFVVDIIVMFFLTLSFAIFFSKGLREVVKKTVLVLILFLSTQLFWILPFVHYTFNVSGDIVDSYVNRTITSSVIDLESENQTALNSAKLFTRAVLETHDGEYIFSYAEDYATYDFYTVIGLLPVVLTVLFLVFAILKKKWFFLLFGIGALFSWFIMKNSNPPGGNIFLWMQENIPLFKQVFRWTSSKSGNIYLLFISLLGSIGFVLILDFLSSFLKKSFRVVLWSVSTLLVIIPILFYGQYLFTGELFPQRALINIPNEYYDLKNFLEENEQTTERILYLPPANNNYFRTYNWGFWGSNFISYVIPNPIIDLSSAIGSEYGEKAVLEIQNAFRAKDKREFDELIIKYDIDYILIDESLDENGFTFSWDWNEVEILWKNKELAYSTSQLSLYKVDNSINNVLLESNSEQNTSFKYSTSVVQSSVLDLNPGIYGNWYIEDNELVSENIYNGDEVILVNDINVTKLLNYPTSAKVNDTSLYLYPSIPYINDSQSNIYKEYRYNNEDFVVIDDNVFDISFLTNSRVSIEEPFGISHSIYFLSSTDFIVDNLTPNLSSSTPYECISGEKEESTEVILQGNATGFELSGQTGIPCIYSEIMTDRYRDGVVKVNINWESINDSLLGYCIYSQNEEKCLNKEKYFSAVDGIGSIDQVLQKIVSRTDQLSFIIYTINSRGTPEVTLRNLSVSYLPTRESSNLISSQVSDYKHSVQLSQEDRYYVRVPIITGENSYKLSSQNSVWQPNIPEDNYFELVNNGLGIYQKVESGFANTSINLFTTQPLSKYLLYWKGNNLSNIPANLCVAYSVENECWVQDMFYDNISTSNLNIFTSDDRSDRLDLSLVSTSYNLPTENLLEDIIVMQYPQVWEDLSYQPEITNIKYEIEADVVGGSNSTVYLLEGSDHNSILTIPQASESGWLAISFKNSIPHILKDRVIVNGWKQGWDISNTEYDNIWVIYYPNLLAYLGYVILITEFFVILFNLVKKRDGR